MLEEIERHITEIEDMASKLTPPSQMAAVLDINEDALKLAISQHGSAVRKAFLRGYAKTASQIREGNIELAAAGSPEAIRSCLSAMKTMLNDIDE